MAAGAGTASYSSPSSPRVSPTQLLPFKLTDPQKLSNLTYVQLLMEMRLAGMVTTDELRIEIEAFYLYNPAPLYFTSHDQP